MAFDIIVFNQEELDRALKSGIRSIALCDNCFSIPDIAGIQYTLIGHVTIDDCAAKVTEQKEEIGEIPPLAYVENKPMSLSSSHSGSFGSSYNSSYGSSYNSSYNSSYKLLYGISSAGGSYGYEYMRGSFSSSYYSFISGFTFEYGSFGVWFGTSFKGSFGFGYYGSYAGSFGYYGSYAGSNAYGGSLLPDIIEYGSSGIIFVNGYGINLI